MPALTDLVTTTRRARLIVAGAVTLACLMAGIGAPDSWKISTHTDYDAQVESLLEGRGLSDRNGRAIDRYPPVFSLLLAATYSTSDVVGLDRFTAVRFVSAGFVVLTALVLFESAALFMPIPCATLAGIVAGTHPHLLAGTFRILTEIPFTTILLAGVLFALRALLEPRTGHRNLQLIASGALTALAMLTRPIALLVPLVTVGALARWRGTSVALRLRSAGLYLAIVLVVVAPWELFVLVRNGELVPLSSGGVASMRDGLSFNHKPARQFLALPRDVQGLTDQFWESYDRYDSVSKIATFMGHALITEPLAVAKLVAIKASRAWYGTDTQDPRFETINVFLLAAYLPLGFAGMIRYAHASPRGRGLMIYLGALVMLFWLMTTAVLSMARYMVPVIALVAAFIPAAFPACRRTPPHLDPV